MAEGTNQGDDEEDSPQPVDDARNGGKEFDEVLEQVLELIRQLAPDRVKLESDRLQQGEHKPGKVVFTEEDGHHQTEQTAYKQAVELYSVPQISGSTPYSLVSGVPRGSRDEAPAILAHGRQGLFRDGVHDVKAPEDRQPGEQVGSPPENDIAPYLQ